MSDSYLRLYVPGLSLLRRFLYRTTPAEGVPIEQLRPNPAYVRLIRCAVNDIQMCQEIFGDWTAPLDKLRSEEFDKQERELRHHLILLREDVTWCSRATDQIILCHEKFAYLMAQRVDDACGPCASQDTTKLASQATTTLANKINKASGELSKQVKETKAHLNSFVSALKKMGKQSIARQLLRGLKHLFNALARLFELGSSMSPFLHIDSSSISVTAPDGKAVSTLRGAVSEISEEKESESYESLLLFLKDVVPKEGQAAQKRLEKFDEALHDMGLEKRMVADCPNPNLTRAAVAEEWRKVARQYKSMVPDDEA